MPVTALTVYPDSFAASLTLSTANTLQTSIGGTGASTITTLIGSATGWGEVYAQGNSAAWAATGSMGSPSGHGWFLDGTLLTTKAIVAGTWTPAWKLKSSANVTVTVSVNVYLYNTSTTAYTAIGSMTKSGVALTTTATDPGITGVSFPTILFPTNTKLYIDLWFNITSVATSGTTVSANQSTTSNQGSTAAQITTPGYSVGYGQKDASSRLSLALLKDTPARFSLALLKNTATRLRLMSGVQQKDSAARFLLARLTNSTTRVRLASLKDAPARFRLMSAGQLKDSASRLLLARLTDTSTRFILTAPTFPTVLGSDTAQRAQHFGGWGTATDGQTWANFGYAATLSVVPPSIVSGYLNLVAPNNAGGRTYCTLGTLLPTDQELLCQMQASNTSIALGLAARYSDQNNNVVASVTGSTLSLVKHVTGTSTTLATATVSFASNTNYWMRLRIVGTSYYVRFWAAGTIEPASWTIDQTTDSSESAGGFGVTTFVHATNDVAQYSYFYAVSYANVESVTSTDTLAEALAWAATDSVTIVDSLPNYFPADALVAFESLLEVLVETLPTDSLTTAEALLYAPVLLQTDSLTGDDSATSYGFALTFATESSVLSDALLTEEDPFATDTVSGLEIASFSLAESATDIIQTLFQTVDSLFLACTFAPQDALATSDALLLTLGTSGTDSVTLVAAHLFTLALVLSADLAGSTSDAYTALLSFAPFESVTSQEALALAFALALTDSGFGTPDALLVTLAVSVGVESLPLAPESLTLAISFLPIESATPVDALALLLALTFAIESAVLLEELDLAFLWVLADSGSASDSLLLAPLSLFVSDLLSPSPDTQTVAITLSTSDIAVLLDSSFSSVLFVPQETLTPIESVLYALAESSAESLSITDFLIAVGSILMSGTDSLVGVESLSLTFLLTAQDAPSLAEVLLSTAALTFGIETLFTSDATALLIAFLPTDSVIPADTLALALALSLAESATPLELMLASTLLTLTADSETPTDVASTFSLVETPAAESLSTSDGGTLALTLLPVESLLFSDAALFVLALSFATESLTALDVLLSTGQARGSDQLTASETATAAGAYTPVDALGESELLVASFALTFAAESSATSDVLLATLLALPVDQAAAALDTLSLAMLFLPVDTGILSETLAAVLVPLFGSESVLASDVLLATLLAFGTDGAALPPDRLLSTNAAVLLDALAATDLLMAALVESSADTLSIVDMLVPFYAISGPLPVDVVTVSEGLLVTLSESSPDIGLSPTDALAFHLDFFTLVAAFVRTGGVGLTVRSGKASASLRDGRATTSAR